MAHVSTTHRRHSFIFLPLMLAALLFICPIEAAAVPIAGYQENLHKAITALDTLKAREAESESDFNNRLGLIISVVRIDLPEHETIETGSETYNVDNSWLHKSLDGLEKQNAQVKAQRLSEVLETLRAIEARVVERQHPGKLIESKEQAQSRLENILARPEYATGARGSNALTRLLQDFMRWLQKFLPKRRTVEPGSVKLISLIAQILVIGAALALLTYVLRMVIKRFRGHGRVKTTRTREPRIVLGERLEPDATATDLLSEAEALARQGDLRAAIRKAYIALLIELGDRKLISLAHHKTNRDYLNSVRSIPQLHSQMRGLTESFERHWYGFAGTTPNDWQDFRAGYLAALRSGS